MAKTRKKITINSLVNRGINTRQNKMDASFRALAETVVSRAALQERLGQSYYSSTSGVPQRDIYKALGYDRNPNFSSYFSRYKRQDIAKAVVDAPVSASWREKPELIDSEKSETAFEKTWSKIVRKKRIYHYLARADRLSRIGMFGVLLVGINDSRKLDQPLGKAKGQSGLLYLRPYTEANVVIQEWEEDMSNPRYGLPKVYSLSTETGNRTARKEGTSVQVHHSRIIHIASDLIDNDIYGTPALESILNRLQDLELVTGGSAEMFWRGAYPGLALKADADAAFTQDDLDDLEDEVQAYMHELRRYLRLNNVDVKELSPQVSDPSNHADLLITLIAAAKRIPKRILLGSESGELASSQDERGWLSSMEDRRTEFIEPVILRPLIDMLIKANILPKPKEEYSLMWPALLALSDKEEADLNDKKITTAKTYVSTPGLETLIPRDMFLTRFMGFQQEELEKIEEMIKDQSEEDKVNEEDNMDEGAMDEEELVEDGMDEEE